jgi:hypothetical protein
VLRKSALEDPLMKIILAALAVTVAAALTGCAPDTTSEVDDVAEAQEALTTTLALGPVGGLVQSTGNLYWTTNTYDAATGLYTAAVHRGSKGNQPGQESTLASEVSSTPVTYGAITWAFPGTYYGYFVANYGAVSQIKRVPLGGGSAVVLATSPASVGARQTLQNDGASLYWGDAAGVQKIPLAGGPVTTLASAANGVGALGIGNNTVYYTAGPDIYSVPKVGGTSVVFSHSPQNAPIGALFVQPTPVDTLYWGDDTGEVFRETSASRRRFQGSPLNGPARISSIAYNGGYIFWTECPPGGAGPCQVARMSDIGFFFPSLTSAPGGTAFLQVDPTYIFYGSLAGLARIQ